MPGAAERYKQILRSNVVLMAVLLIAVLLSAGMSSATSPPTAGWGGMS